MAVNLTKHTINGSYENTVVYTITNFRYDDGDDKLKWDAFKFYTPEGTQVEDGTGYHYFDIGTEEYLLERHATLNKELIIKADETSGVEAIEIEEGSEADGITMGLEGDIILSGIIPSTADGSDIEIDYKEVTG